MAAIAAAGNARFPLTQRSLSVFSPTSAPCLGPDRPARSLPCRSDQQNDSSAVNTSSASPTMTVRLGPASTAPRSSVRDPRCAFRDRWRQAFTMDRRAPFNAAQGVRRKGGVRGATQIDLIIDPPTDNVVQIRRLLLYPANFAIFLAQASETASES
jgi:hypothetical protein